MSLAYANCLRYFPHIVLSSKLSSMFKSALSDDKLEVTALSMGEDNLPALIRETEEARRMAEMRAQFEKMRTNDDNDPYKDLDSMFPIKKDLVINTDNKLISKLIALNEMGTSEDNVKLLATHIYDQACLAHGSLDSEGLNRFLKNNAEIISSSLE